MNIIIIAITIALASVFAIDIRDGALDVLPGEQYGTMKQETKKLPFKAITPAYIPKGFKFLEEDSLKLLSDNSAGIPQVNFLYETEDGKNGLVLKQYEISRYKNDVLGLLKAVDFPSYFKNHRKMNIVEKNGKTLYVNVSSTKTRTLFGEEKYIGSADLLRADSLIEVSYYGDSLISQDEILKILLSLKS